MDRHGTFPRYCQKCGLGLDGWQSSLPARLILVHPPVPHGGLRIVARSEKQFAPRQELFKTQMRETADFTQSFKGASTGLFN